MGDDKEIRICGGCEHRWESTSILNKVKVFRCYINDDPMRPGERVGKKAKCYHGLKKIILDTHNKVK